MNKELEIKNNLKPRPKTIRRAYATYRKAPVGNFELAVAPDQYCLKANCLKNSRLDSINQDVIFAGIEDIKSIILKAIEQGFRVVRLKFGPAEFDSVDIELSYDNGQANLLDYEHDNCSKNKIIEVAVIGEYALTPFQALLSEIYPIF